MASNGSIQAKAAVQTCPIHEEEEMDMYFKTCKKPFCHECVNENHLQHKWLPMKKLAQELRANARTREREVTSQLESISNGQEKVYQYLHAESERNKSQCMSVLESTRSEIHRITDEIIDNRQQEFGNFFDDRKGKRESSRQKMQQELQKLKVFRDQLRNEATTMSNLDIVELYDEIDEALSSLRNPGQLLEECFDISEMKKGDESRFREAVGEMIGRSDIQKRKATDMSVTLIKSHVFGHSKVNVICPVSNSTAWIRCDKLCRLVNLEGEEITTADTETPVYNFDISSDGRITFCNPDDQTVKCITESGILETLYSTKPLIPLFISITHSGDHLISLVDEEAEVRKDTSRRIVRRATTSGDTIKEYEYDSDSRTPIFIKPAKTVEHCNSDLCVLNWYQCDGGENTGIVVGLTYSGSVRFKYNGTNGDNTFDPITISCDMTGNTLINDSVSGIHLIDAQGKLVKFLLTKDALSYDPYAIALRDNRLWIGSYQEGKVSVYDYK